MLEWKPLLEKEKYKQVIIQSLKYLVANKQIALFAFVLMRNHIHLIWRVLPGRTPSQVQHSFLKYTAQQIKFDLLFHHPLALELYKVNAKDRAYQFWERNSLGIEIYSTKVFNQKLNYLHWNPVKAGLCNSPEEYYYSSARFYQSGVAKFTMLTHY
ncbi:MAG: transposase [Bacteroidota bacterium]